MSFICVFDVAVFLSSFVTFKLALGSTNAGGSNTQNSFLFSSKSTAGGKSKDFEKEQNARRNYQDG